MKKILILTLIALMLLVFGCTQSQPATNTNTQNDNPMNSLNNNSNNTSSPTNTNGENSSENNSNEFTDFVNSIGQLNEYKITYKMTTSFNGQTSSSQFTQYKKGNKMRMDTFGLSNSSIYYLEEGTYMCNGEGEEITCMEMPEADMTDSGQLPSMDPSEFQNNSNITPLPDRQIAGQTAKCFSVNFSPVNVSMSAEYCGANGILLYVKTTTEEGTIQWEATEFTTSVPDSDFELPVEQPTSLDDMMNNIPDMPNGE